MNGADQLETKKKIKQLISKAEDEDKKYNWTNALEILKEAEKICLGNNFGELLGDIYYNLGEHYNIIADFEKIKEKVLDNYRLAIAHFQKAYGIFKNLKDEGKINACLGSLSLLKYIFGSKEIIKESLLLAARQHFRTAKLKNSEAGERIEALKMAIFESRALGLLLGEKCLRLDEKADYKGIANIYENILTVIWPEIKNGQDLPELLLYHFFYSIMQFSFWFLTSFPIDIQKIKEHYLDRLEKMYEFIENFENSPKILSYFNALTFSSWLNMGLVERYGTTLFEQKKIIKKAENLLKKGAKILPKIKANLSLAFFHYIRFTNALYLIYLGFFTKDFKIVLEDFDEAIQNMFLILPQINAAFAISYGVLVLLIGASTPTTPDVQRLFFVRRALDIIESASIEISVLNNLNYKLISLMKNSIICQGNAFLGDLVEAKEEKLDYLQITTRIFREISKFRTDKWASAHTYYIFLVFISSAGRILAKHESRKFEKIKYYEDVIDLYLNVKLIATVAQLEKLFVMGDIYQELGRLTNDDQYLQKSYRFYIDAINQCETVGYFNIMGLGYSNLAHLDDRLGNFLSAAENYQKAIDSFDKAMETFTYSGLRKKLEKLKDYMKAWKIIETAKAAHAKEDHENANTYYEQASQILKKIRGYKYEAPFYTAWAILEKAENLSKQGKHQEAAVTYQLAEKNFQEAREKFDSMLKKKKEEDERIHISKLSQVAEIRMKYCKARYLIETARSESKQGNQKLASQLYKNASSLFQNLCHTYIIRRERDELIAVFYMCKAWESMERADVEQQSSLYETASELFKKASTHFPESRMKKLATGNSFYCSALQYGSLFDKTPDIRKKMEYYKFVKINLRESSTNYQMGGFDKDAQWALATSTFFDGVWQLIQADNEMDFVKKNQLLAMATKYLEMAHDLFEDAGYEQKKEVILKHLAMIKAEKAILTSALDVIEKPAISSSSIGISAPSCPVETSSSVELSEMQKMDLEVESEINWNKRIHHLYVFMPTGICIYDQSFKIDTEIAPELVAGGLMGISTLIQELTQSHSKIKIVEQEEMTIMLEHGKYSSAALITEENLLTLRDKLVEFLKEIEEFYQEELEQFFGNVDQFTKLEKFVNKIFIK